MVHIILVERVLARDDHSPEAVEIEENQYTLMYDIHIAISYPTTV